MKTIIFEEVERMKEMLFTLSDDIFNNPELAFKEFYAAKRLSDVLEENGFIVEREIGTLKTAFQGSFTLGEKSYPTIGILAEYDALEMGHACGHNIIATTAIGAGLSLKKAMEENNIQGTLKVIGTPAEETGGGKIIMQENNVFDGVDALLLLHPTSATTKVAGRCKTSHIIEVKFIGKQTNSISRPDQGINATEGSVIAFQGMSSLLKYLPKDVSIFPLITDSNRVDGLMPDESSMHITITAFEDESVERAITSVENVIKGSALSTGNKYEINHVGGYKGRVVNETIGNLLLSNLDILGEKRMEGFVDDNGFEDFGNLNRVIPGAMVYPTILPERKISNHTEEFKERANSKKSQDVILLGSRVMAYTALDLFNNPELVEKAKAEIE